MCRRQLTPHQNRAPDPTNHHHAHPKTTQPPPNRTQPPQKQQKPNSDKLLFIPATPQDFARADRWLLVDRSRVSADGADCDRVGTGFSAFRNQAGGCGRAPGSCLRGQLADLLEADEARAAQGMAPLYSVKQFSHGASSGLSRAPGSGDVAFALPLASRRSSVVTVEVAADSARFVTNASPGRLTAARMCAYGAARCGGFEALSARGYLWANVTNTGSVAASYTLGVANCSAGVGAVEARRLALGANETAAVEPFEIYVQDGADDGDRRCWLMLRDSVGRLSDKALVPFFTNATQWGEVPRGGLGGKGDGARGAPLSRAECAVACGALHNVKCHWRNKCWQRVGSFFGLIGGLVGGGERDRERGVIV